MLQTKILDGDYVVNSRRCFVTATEIEEILQRVMICLKVKKGSFYLDKQLGNELFSINLAEMNSNMIKAYICDALEKIKEVQVISVERLKKLQTTTLSLEITIRIFKQIVKINI